MSRPPEPPTDFTSVEEATTEEPLAKKFAAPKEPPKEAPKEAPKALDLRPPPVPTLPKPISYVIERDARVNLDGGLAMLRAGKIVDSARWDIPALKLQGVSLKEIT